MKNVRRLALKDLAKEGFYYPPNSDMWDVSAWSLDTKEVKKLNAELGVNKINYLGRNNNKTNT